MKYILLPCKLVMMIALLLTPDTTLYGQQAEGKEEEVSLKTAGITWAFPNKEWKLLDRQKNKNTELFSYARTPIVSGDKTITPTLTVMVDQLSGYTDLRAYSQRKLSPLEKQKEFNIEKVFTSSDGMLQLPYAIGYKTTYKDSSANKHVLYVIHGIKNTKGIQLWLDITSELYDEYEEELTSIIRSMGYQ